MFLAGNFEHRGNGMIVVLENVSNVVGNVLIDEDNPDVFSRGKVLKGFFDLLQFGILFDNEKVGVLRVSMSDSGEQEASDSVLKNKRVCHWSVRLSNRSNNDESSVDCTSGVSYLVANDSNQLSYFLRESIGTYIECVRRMKPRQDEINDTDNGIASKELLQTERWKCNQSKFCWTSQCRIICNQ